MRNDMSHVLIDRPRRGGDDGQHKRSNRRKFNDPRGFDDAPTKGSTGARRQYGYEAKEFDDHLAPLWRFVRSRVGKPWDKVYSEVCEHLKATSVTQRHVLEHLDGMVEKNAVMVGKVPHHYWYGMSLRPLTSSSFYVHPKTGLLREVPKESSKAGDKRRQEAAALRNRYLHGFQDGRFYLWKKGDLWVRSELRTRANFDAFGVTGQRTCFVYDWCLDKMSSDTGFGSARRERYPAEFLKDNRYCATKPEVISKYELARLGLRNGPDPESVKAVIR